MRWKLWGRGLIAAMISAVASSLMVLIADPLTYNFTGGAGKLVRLAGVAAATGGLLYLKKHPNPWEDAVEGTPPAVVVPAVVLPPVVVAQPPAAQPQTSPTTPRPPAA